MSTFVPGTAPWLAALNSGERAAPGGDPPAAGPSEPGWWRAWSDRSPSPQSPEAPEHPLLAPAEPLVARAAARVRASLDGLAGPGRLDPEALGAGFRRAAAFRVLGILERTLVLELHVARLEGRLSGATGEERFRSFAGRLRDPAAVAALLEEYPVLARLVAERLRRAERAFTETAARWASDRDAVVREVLGGRDPGLLNALEGGAGDLHRGGRSVHLLGFDSGARVVYKPRSMAVDARFQELLQFLSPEGGGAPEPELLSHRTLAVLDRGTHGWSEFVAAAPCRDAAGVDRHHRRLGQLLALLHILEATDLHFENLIAAGEEPVPVDLETLFHPRPVRPPVASPDLRLTREAVDRSVLRVGLLPFRVGEGDGFEGVDVSGFASVEGQLTPDPVLRWEEAGTDAMHAARARLPMPGGANRPVLDGREADAADHVDAVAAGFTAMWRRLEERREALLAPGGPLARFAGTPVRAVLRATRAYALLLSESTHPDLLRDARDRDRHFDRLAVGVEDLPVLRRAIPAEHRDLWRGDVPSFTCVPAGTGLVTSDGEQLAGFFEEPALDAVRRRLDALGDEAELDRQRHLVRLALGTLALNRADPDRPPYAPPADADLLPGEGIAGELVARARRIGDWFATQAVRDGDLATWLGVEFREKRWTLVPMVEDLYAGVPGIALFLAYLGAVTGEERYLELARAGRRALEARLEREGSGLTAVGAMNGWGGVLYADAHLGALGADPGALDRAARIARRIPALLALDEDRDVVGGAAGAGAAILALHRATGDPDLLPAARACGESLLASARETGDGLAWVTRIGGDAPQIGFSHGNAGIGWALCELGRALDEPRYLEAARRALALERRLFWPELERWLDAPAGADAPIERAVAMAWCYGAPGIGYSRLGALRSLGDGALREELERAVRLTVERGFGRNHCLCHGDLGNLDFLDAAARFTGNPDLAAAVRDRTRRVVASLDRDGPLPGTRGGVDSAGLLNGRAGIGLGLLRLAAPGRVPSVLVLEPPEPR